jgi:hypothetical protein
MLFSEMTQEEKDQFFKEQEARVQKLRDKRPLMNLDKIVSQEEVERLKEEKKRKARSLYFNYHKKPSNHPDNWKKL